MIILNFVLMTNEILLAAAEQYGTPLYVYSAEKIKNQADLLKQNFSKRVKIFYACKALTNIHILKYIHKLGLNIDCVSINEIKLALLAGFKPEQILFTSNGIDINEVAEAVEIGVHINLDNLSIIEDFGEKYGGNYPLCIRINPHIMAGGNLKISTGHIDSKFGISIDFIEDILRVVEKYKLNVKGIHVHTGSEINDIEVYKQVVEKMLSISSYFTNLEFIDLGGGFKVSYKENEPSIDIVQLAAMYENCFLEHKQKTGKDLDIWVEPGKFMVSESGYFITKVTHLKKSPNRKFAFVDSGFNHLIRPMFYDAYHKIENLSNAQAEQYIYNIVGNICETDTFAWDRSINEIRKGDLLVFKNAGAYGFEMSSNFNSRLKPAEIFYENGNFKLIRRREVFDDLLNTLTIEE